MLNICIDIDGTITEPYYWLERANQYFNTKVKPKDVTTYEIEEILGVPRSEYDSFYMKFGEQIHRETLIRFGAKEVITKLHIDHQIHFVTARAEKMREVSFNWLVKHQVPLHSITLLGSHDKVNQARLLEADLFIEDRYENALQLAEAGFEVVLVDCTYNKGPLPENVTRLKSWYQIYKWFEMRMMQEGMTEEELALAL